MSDKLRIGQVEYHDLFSLAEAMSSCDSNLFSAFEEDRAVMEFIKSHDFEKHHKVKALRREKLLPEIFAFKAALILNPHLPLTYHGYRFKDYCDIGDHIISFAPEVDVYIQDLLTFGLLKEYMVLQDDEISRPSLYQQVCLCTELSKHDKNLAYFRLGFHLYGTKNFFYNKRQYHDLHHFIAASLSENNLLALAETFEEDRFLFALEIETHGSTDIYDRYRHIVDITEGKEQKLQEEMDFNKTSK